MHGAEETPLEALLTMDGPGSSGRLARILIDSSLSAAMLRSLRALGINKTTLFPEAQSVSDDLKRLYKIT